MTDLTAVQEAVSQGNYQYTLHAVQRATERHISRKEIEQAVSWAEIIEEYPQDKPRSCNNQIIPKIQGGLVAHLFSIL